jgi:hypothetical protein
MNGGHDAAKSFGEVDEALLGAVGIAFGDGDGGLDGHGANIWVLARLLDLAEDEEGPIGRDLDGDLGVLDVFLS